MRLYAYPLAVMWVVCASITLVSADQLRSVEGIDPPAGYERLEAADGWQKWIRAVKLEPPGWAVKDYNGDPVAPPCEVVEVTNLPVLGRSCQCADMAILLWARYLREIGRADAIRFKSLSGQWMVWGDFKRGARWFPSDDGRRLIKNFSGRKVGASYSEDRAFADYLKVVFDYANSGSLYRDLEPIGDDEVMPGDLYVQPPSSSPGSYGHVSICFDVAGNPEGEKVYLMGYGWIPAMSLFIARPGMLQGRGDWFTEPGFRRHVAWFGDGRWMRWKSPDNS